MQDTPDPSLTLPTEAAAETPPESQDQRQDPTPPAALDNAAAAPSNATATREISPAACAGLLKQHFPALFGGPPKPLKLRIQADINQRAPGVFTKPALSAFFRRYTGSTAYLIALGKATQRFDLDGQPAGELSEEHRNLAREELARRRQVSRERDQQAQAQVQAQHAQVLQAQQAQARNEQALVSDQQREQQRVQREQQREQQRAEQQAQRAQQAQQTEATQERQMRLALLRDFDRTPLTLNNFCALKGLKPETLAPMLALARKEAAENPAPAPLEDRRPPGHWRDAGPGARRDERAAPRQDSRDGRGDRPTERANDRPNDRPDDRRGDGRNSRTAAHPPGNRPSGRPPSR